MRELIVAEAHSWLDVPFRIGGNDRSGIDCSHLAGKCLRAAGFKIIAWCDWLFLNLPVKPLHLLEFGDLVFWQLKNNHPSNRLIRHVGIYIGDQQIIHASSLAGRVIKSAASSSDLDHLVFVEARTEEMIRQWIQEIQKRPS